MQKHTTRIAHTLPLAHMARRTLIKASCKASNVACIFFWGVCACAGVRLIRTVANQSVSIHLWLLLHPVQHPSDEGITAAGDVLDCWRQHCRRQQMLHSFFLVPLTRQRKEYILPITGLRTINFIKYTYLTTSCSVLGQGDYRQIDRQEFRQAGKGVKGKGRVGQRQGTARPRRGAAEERRHWRLQRLVVLIALALSS